MAEGKKGTNVLGIVLGIVVLGGTVFAISWAWKKGQKVAG